MAIDDLSQLRADFEKLWKRVERMERGAPIGFSSVSRGALRITSDEGLIVQGSASVSGILKGVGQMLWDGIATFTGAFTSKGTTRFEGDTSQVGPFHITGNTDQTGTYTVNSPGKIIVAGSNAMTLGVGAFGQPGVGFATGGGVTGFTGGALLHGGTAGVGCIVNGTTSQLASGSNYVSVTATDTSVTGPFRTTGVVNLNSLPSVSATGKTPNVWIDTNGKLWKLI